MVDIEDSLQENLEVCKMDLSTSNSFFPPKEPSLPVSLRLRFGSLYSQKQERLGLALVTHIKSHMSKCQMTTCKDPCCVYFNWFIQHHHDCPQQDKCPSCCKLMEWISLHSESCGETTECPLEQLCTRMKTLHLKDSLKEFNRGVVSCFVKRSSPCLKPSTHSSSKSGTSCNFQNGSSECNGKGLHSTEIIGHNPHSIPNGTTLNENRYYLGQSGNHLSQQSGNEPHSWQNGNHSGNGQQNGNGQHFGKNGDGYLRQNEQLGQHSDHTLTNISLQYLNSSHDPKPLSSSAFSQSSMNGAHDPPNSLFPPSPSHVNALTRDTEVDILAGLNPLMTGPPEFEAMTRFGRTYSVSSTTSERDRQTALKAQELNNYYRQQVNEGATEQQKRMAITALKSRVHSSETMSGSIEGMSAVSCGDGEIGRLESIETSLFGSIEGEGWTTTEPGVTRTKLSRGPGMESRTNSSHNDGNESEMSSHRISNSQYQIQTEKHEAVSMPDFSSSRTEDSDGLNPRKMRKRWSDNKLVRMQNVEESIDISTSPLPGGSPTPHTPVQRTVSENRKVLVNGPVGTSITIRDRSCDEGESEMRDEVSVTSAGERGEGECDQEVLSMPMQRDASIDSGTRDKFLLGPGRGSISMASYRDISRCESPFDCFKAKRNAESLPPQQLPTMLSSDANSVPCGGFHHLRTPSPTSSPNFSTSSSQPSSLGESSSGGEGSEGAPKLNYPTRENPEASLTPQYFSLYQHQAKHPIIGQGLPTSTPTSWNGQCYFASTPSTIKNLHSGSSALSDNCEMNSNIADGLPSSTNGIGHRYRCGDTVFDGESKSSSYSHVNDVSSHGNVVSSHGNGVSNYGNGMSSHGNCDMLHNSHGDGSCVDDSEVTLDPHIFAPSSLTDSDVSVCMRISHAHQRSRSDSDFSQDASVPQDHLSMECPPRAAACITKEEIEGIYARIDEITELHRGDLEVMRNRGKILRQQRPVVPPGETVMERKDHLYLWDKDADGPQDDLQAASQYHEEEMKLYIKELTPRDPDRAAEEEVNHREYLRQYLLGQFQRKQVYGEYTHWNRLRKLGRGGQATCYGIQDRSTKLMLALKEESENDKSLDEAYVCLKLSYEFNVSRNIVEYFSAAMLPITSTKNIIQLFMEIMPTCMQSYLHTNGPLCMADVHHFSFQLFDALEFLHIRERIIHCDIKPANLLLDITAQHMKLTDFGAAELLEERRRPSDRIHCDTCGGTLHYNPPEYYSRGGECSFALDSWQAGCCVLAMCTGRRPWRHLYMDPVFPKEERSRLDRVQSFNSLKKHYSSVIGKEQEGHMTPAFLDEDIKKLLYGCLHSDSSLRLTAIDCRQLLAFSQEMDEDQTKKVSDAIGYPRSTPNVLQSYSPSHAHIDIFLGSYYKRTISGHDHTLYPGWLGSLPYQPGMTYEDLHQMIFFSAAFPVLEHLAPLEMSLLDESPQEFFVTTKPNDSTSTQQRHFHPLIDQRQTVDPSKSVVLFQPLTQRNIF